MSTCRRRDWTGWRSSRSRRREGSRSADGTSPPRPARRRSSTAPRRTRARTRGRCWRTPARGDAVTRPERDRRHGRRNGAQGQAPGELQPAGSDVLFPGRQLENKRGAALGTVLSPELATELGDDAVGDREAEPASLAGGLGREERVEDPRHQFCRDPRPGVAHFQADARAVRPAAHRQHTRPGTLDHRLVRVLHEVQEHLLELVLVPQHMGARRELGDDLHVVQLELVALQLEYPARLFDERARPALRRGLPGEEQEILDDAGGARGLVRHDPEALAHLLRRLGIREQELRLAEDRREGVVDLMRDPRGELAHGGQLLGVDELCVGAPELLELAAHLGVEAGVVEREPDLVGGRLEERDLAPLEAVEDLAAERERAEDPAAAVDRHADETPDALAPDRGPGGREQVWVRVVFLDPDRPARGGDTTDQALADRQHLVDGAQARRHPALAPKVQRPAVLREEVEARDLVARDARQRLDRRAQHVVPVEGAALRRGDGVEDLEVRRDGRPNERPAPPVAARRGLSGAPLQARSRPDAGLIAPYSIL